MKVQIKSTAEVIKEFQELKKADKFSQAELDQIALWSRLVKTHGSLILQKIIEAEELEPGSAAEQRALSRAPQKYNLFKDHALDREWTGNRSSSISHEGRIIYRTDIDGTVEIVQIKRITPDHNYKIKKEGV